MHCAHLSYNVLYHGGNVILCIEETFFITNCVDLVALQAYVSKGEGGGIWHDLLTRTLSSRSNVDRSLVTIVSAILRSVWDMNGPRRTTTD